MKRPSIKFDFSYFSLTDRKKLVPTLLSIALCITAITAAILYRQSGAPERQAENIVASVGRLMVLPMDEEPTVATVASPEQLKDQPFFAQAKQGDKVLIYTKARRAILYDPVAHKIIDIAPLSITQ